MDLTDIHEYLSYDPETGIFRWINRPSNRVQIGDRAGGQNADGYRLIGFRGYRYLAHHLAWFFVHGEWPKSGIDHKDMTPGNDWISNLRLATKSQNAMNSKLRRDNTSGCRGVTFHKEMGQWWARIRINGRDQPLGYFDLPVDAAHAYDAAAREHFGEFARLNFPG